MTDKPNQKKLKTDIETQSDATVRITSTSTSFQNPIPGVLIPGALISDNLFFIEKQGKSSVESKLTRILTVGDEVVLLKDFPDVDIYKGYLCTIIASFGGEFEETFYEIEFFSRFDIDDYSQKSKQKNVDFEFPISSYTTFVRGQDLIRLETQDLYYKTCFS